MSRLGQCPSCRIVYELEDDAIGQVIDCQCGAALFACDVSGFSEIPVFCTQCDGEYVVDADGAGENVQCECGAELSVPTAVLRMPVASRGSTPQSLLKEQPSTDADVRVVSCPKCNRQYSIADDDLGEEAVCQCKCIFVVTAADDGTVTVRPKRSRNDQADTNVPAVRKKPMSIWSIVGIAAVGLLLLVSIVMFVTRNSNRERVAGKETGKTTGTKTDPADAIPDDAAIQSSPLIAGATVRPIPAPSQVTQSDANTDADQQPDGKGPGQPSFLTPPPEKPLPKAKPPRNMVAVIPATNRGLTFSRAYAEAFAAYEETNELKKKLASGADDQDYQQQLGVTIGMLQQTLELASRQGEAEALNELRYLLTYLYYTAGRLPEAIVMGQAVARWGKPKQPATKEAAMIALAATQEASESAWGIPGSVGELDQMRILADLIAKRWPDDPQLDLIWMGLGQRLESYRQHRKAAAAYARVSNKAKHFGAAQLAAGTALWTQYRITLATNTEQSSAKSDQLLTRAETMMDRGVTALTAANEKPTKSVLSAKLTLARMAILSADLDKAEARLIGGPAPVIDSVSIDKDSDATVQVSDAFLRAVFETLFTIRTQKRDPTGAKVALEMMSAKLGPEADADVGKMFLSVAADYIDTLTARQTVTRQQFSTLSELIEPIKEHDQTLTVPNVLWLGESWSKLAERAATPDLAKQCYGKAAAAYEIAVSRNDFPKPSLQSATLRRAQLLRNAGNIEDAIPLLESILSETPNAFALQIEGAEALQQLAIESGQANRLRAAIDGPDAASPIWGWAKLITTLNAARSGDEDQARDRLLKCQYNLYLCKLLLAQANPDTTQRGKSLADLNRTLARLVATTSPDREPWYAKLQELQQQTSTE